MKRLLPWLEIVFLVGLVLTLGLAMAGCSSNPAPFADPPAQAQEPTPVEYPIGRGGSLTVPGGIAYIDARSSFQRLRRSAGGPAPQSRNVNPQSGNRDTNGTRLPIETKVPRAMAVDLWEQNGPDRGKKVCTVSHGQKVTLIDTFLRAGGHPLFREFKISNNGCTGWVHQSFLSAER